MATAKSKLHDIKTHKMPEQSILYDRIVPVIFVALGIVTVVVIIVSLGILTGLIRWL
jgi:hypothetical protein